MIIRIKKWKCIVSKIRISIKQFKKKNSFVSLESLDRVEDSEKLEEWFPFFFMYSFYRHFLFPDWSNILDEVGKKLFLIVVLFFPTI